MEQHNQEIGTRRDLMLYRLETARNDLKSAIAVFYEIAIQKKLNKKADISVCILSSYCFFLYFYSCNLSSFTFL